MKNICFVLMIFCLNVSKLYGMPSTHMLKDVPEEYMNLTEIMRYYGYPCEVHTVTTDDGYILTIHRIPHGRHGNTSVGFPVFLQHGFLDSASTWIMNLPSQSLAFILADAGYDVWLGNSRGNVYSSKHVNLTTNDDKYWDFSFDEMAKYDIPACLDYITHSTSHSQLNYVGHSQGTSIGFIAFEEEEVASKVKTFFALAPVTTVAHIKGAIKVLSDLAPEIKELLDILGVHDFLPSNKLLEFLAQKVCGGSHQAEIVCGNIAFLIAGFDTSNLNDTRVPVYLSHFPSGTSVKDLFHYLQMVKSGKFCKYDYGEEENQKRYGQPDPPLYDVSSVKTPVAVFYGGQDWLSDVDDVRKSVLPFLHNPLVVKYNETWNHLDFVWGVDANEYLYNVVLKIMGGP